MQEFIAYFLQASVAERGIVIATDSPDRLIQKLHAARREAKNPLFDNLVVCKSRTAPDREVWITVKEDPNAAQESSTAGAGDTQSGEG